MQTLLPNNQSLQHTFSRHSGGLNDSLFRWRTTLTAATVLFVSISACLPIAAFADAASASAGSDGEAGIRIETFGVGGVFRPGLWTDAVVRIDGGADGVSGSLRVMLEDGDGQPAVFGSERLGTISVERGASQTVRLPVKVGRTDGRAVVSLVDEAGASVLSHAVSVTQLARPLSPLQPIFIQIGDDVGLSRRVSLINRSYPETEQIVLITLDSLADFPVTWLGAEGIELVYISTSGKATADFPPEQSAALRAWIKTGGKLIIWTGDDAGEFFGEGEPLAKLVGADADGGEFKGAEFQGIEEIYDGLVLENYVTAKQELLGPDDTWKVARFSKAGATELATDDIPLVSALQVGFGRITLVSFALDRAPLLNWKYRDALLEKIVSSSTENDRQGIRQSEAGRVLHIGYSDIAGQLRSSMDQFRNVGFITFTIVAALTTLYLLCIGPGDYFLLRRLLGKMELTWITFPLLTILFGAAAIFLFQRLKTDRMQVNQVEIIDVDERSRFARGTIWSHVYSPTTQSVDLKYEFEDSDVGEAGSDTPSSAGDGLAVKARNFALAWQGFPGDSLGGMSSATGTTTSNVRYGIEESGRGENSSMQIRQLPLQVASTRSFAARWDGVCDRDIESNLRSAGPETRLLGRIRNVFDFTLSDAVVLYGQWAYSLNRDVKPGEWIVAEADLRERSLSGYLTRSRLIDGRDRAPIWDPSDVNTQRIVEMMMFYSAAGGQDYTGLSQRFTISTDLSSSLTDDTAILIVGAKKTAHPLQVNDVAVTEEYDQQFTFYRILLPVEVTAR